MIEIEKKFLLNDAERERLLSGATFMETVVNIDTYFDLEDHSLTCRDCWLRKRNSNWELKIPLHALGEKTAVTHYRELTEHDEILAVLEFNFAEYQPFCTIVTTRRRYKKNDFSIDLDSCDFGYDLVEIELMVSEDDDRAAATELILAFAQKYGLRTDRVRGKILEYLRRFRPDHLRQLVEAGVAKQQDL